jgi:hypothetical protein
MSRRRRPVAILAGLGLAAAGLAVIAGQFTGLIALETHRGVDHAIWSADGERVLYLRRTARLLVVGPGWEHFTPPARVRPLADRIEIVEQDPATGVARVLGTIPLAPLVGRWTPRYRGRIAGLTRARIDPADGTLAVAVSRPVQPSSEVRVWRGTLDGTGAWSDAPTSGLVAGEAVLANGIELIVWPGPESLGAAVLAQDAAGSVSVVTAVEDFDLAAVSRERLAERSRRSTIERIRLLRETLETRTAVHRSAGASPNRARRAAHDDAVALGLLPRDPTVTATRIDAVPAGAPVFEIPRHYLDVGLFSDIAAAIADPATPVDADTGDHLRYRDDDLGPRLAAYRHGHDVVHLRVDGVLWRLTRQRYDWDGGTP